LVAYEVEVLDPNNELPNKPSLFLVESSKKSSKASVSLKDIAVPPVF
jgi:hypothetical protein